MFAQADRPFGSGLFPRDAWDDDEQEDAEDEDEPLAEDGESDDSTEYRRGGVGLTGLSVRW